MTTYSDADEHADAMLTTRVDCADGDGGPPEATAHQHQTTPWVCEC